MSSLATPFYVNLLDASGERLNEGPLLNLQTLNDTRRLDQIGSLEFMIPVTEERAQFITAGSQFDVFDARDGYLGRYYYESKREVHQSNAPSQIEIRAHDQLVELSRQSVYFRRTYTALAVDLVVADLVGQAEGWSASSDLDIGTTSVTYEGNSVLNALDVLRDRWGQHLRLGAERHLQFGAFGAPSGVVLTRLAGQVQANIQRNRDVALVSSLQFIEEADEVFNYIVPLGAGQGVSQLTIETASGGEYSVETGTNADGSNFYYIADDDSIAQYGLRQKVLTFPSIRPITNSDADIANAATALKSAAEAYLVRHTQPLVTYSAPVSLLRQPVRVGDTVRLQYRGKVENYSYVDLDADFYVMDITRRRSADGTRSADLVLSTIAARRTSDTDVVLETIADVRALKIDVPITITYSPVGPYVKRVSQSVPADFTIRIGDEVTFLNRALLRFKTSPLKSSIQTVGAADEDTSSSETHTHNVVDSGEHTHEVTISGGGAHQHDVTITSTGLGSTQDGGSTTPTTDSTVPHFHDILINHSGSPSGSDLYWSEGIGLNTNAGSGTNAFTEIEDEHTHDVTIPDHSHGIDHDHAGSTTSSEPADLTGATAESETHNHDIQASGSHEHTIPAHNHAVTYGVFEDDVYPQQISLSINGVDVTAGLGGPWSPTNAPSEHELNITSYLVNAVGGLRQNHLCEFTCGATSQGEIEFEVDLMVSIQAIAVS